MDRENRGQDHTPGLSKLLPILLPRKSGSLNLNQRPKSQKAFFLRWHKIKGTNQSEPGFLGCSATVMANYVKQAWPPVILISVH